MEMCTYRRLFGVAVGYDVIRVGVDGPQFFRGIVQGGVDREIFHLVRCVPATTRNSHVIGSRFQLVKVCLHVTLSSQSKFNIVPVVTDTQIAKMVAHPFFPLKCLSKMSKVPLMVPVN